MSTRGSYGFYKDGIDKLTYNHYDSYPEALGQTMIKFIKETSEEELNSIFNSIKLVDEESHPNDKEKEHLKRLGYIYEYRGEKLDWFNIVGPTLGDLDVLKDGLVYMIEKNGFIKESLFCEWAYIFNLDTNELEVYKGFQKEPTECRYKTTTSTSRSGEYFNCKLLVSIPFEEVRNIDELVEYLLAKNLLD